MVIDDSIMIEPILTAQLHYHFLVSWQIDLRTRGKGTSWTDTHTYHYNQLKNLAKYKYSISKYNFYSELDLEPVDTIVPLHHHQ